MDEYMHVVNSLECILQDLARDSDILGKRVDDAVENGDTQAQIQSLKDYSVNYGKIKMLSDVICFMRKEIE